MSRVVLGAIQQLESEIKAAATSTAATAELNTRIVVEGVRRDIQAQIEQTRADVHRRDEEARQQMAEISVGLAALTTQLNQFKSASTHVVAGTQKQMSDAVDHRLNVQSQRMDTLNENVQKAQKISSDNSDLLQGLLIGIENLSENFKQFKSDVESRINPTSQDHMDTENVAEREYNEATTELL